MIVRKSVSGHIKKYKFGYLINTKKGYDNLYEIKVENVLNNC